MEKFKLKLKNLFKKIFCPNCGSFHSLERGYWHRAWNNLCGQGAGDHGDRCYDCGTIFWDKTPEEFMKTKQSWISKPYDLK